MLHLRALSQSEGILDIDAAVADQVGDRALDLRMAEQNLYGAKVSLDNLACWMNAL